MVDLKLTATVDIEAAAPGKRPTFRMLAYTGAPMRVGGFSMPVVVDLAGAKINDPLVILRDHDPGRVIGQGRGEIGPAGLVLAGTVTGDDADSQAIVTHAKNGFRWQASIGADINMSATVREGEKVTVNGRSLVGPLFVAQKTAIKEVSFVAMGADDQTTVDVAASQNAEPIDPRPTYSATTYGGRRIHGGAPVHSGRPPLTAEQSELICSLFTEDVDPDGSYLRVALRERWSEDFARGYALNLIHSRRATPAFGYSIGQFRSGQSGVDAKAALGCQLMAMAGRQDLIAKQHGEQALDHIRRPSGWVEFAASALTSMGLDVPRGRDEVIKAAFSTASISSVIGGTVQKIALATFLDAASNWRPLVRVVPAVDFKEGQAVRLASSAGFRRVPRGGEIEHGSLSDEAHSFQVATYGRMFGITREDIIDDDLGLLTDVPLILGNEGARAVADAVFSALVGNAGSFFSVGHENLTHGDLDVDGVSEAVRTLRVQTDADGRVIGFRPATLVVPAAREAEARVLLSSMALARDLSTDQQPTGNPLAGLNLALVVEPRLDANSTADWYLFSPGSDGAILAAFLDGVQGPRVESQEAPFNRLGIQYRAYMDFGISLAEHRAAVKGDVAPYA